MANWNTGAAFSNSFLNTIQGLTALQNAQMQNARMANALKQEVGYETAVAEESTKAKGLDLNKISEGLKFQDIKYDTGETMTADQQRQAWQQALPELQKLTPAEQQQAINALGQTELGQGLGLEKLKTYQTAGGETKFNQLGREAMASDVNRAVRQRMLETGNIYGQERSLQMGKLTREDEAAQAEMDFSNWMTDNMKQIQQDPTKWVQDNLTGYNKAGKGSFLNDGMTGKVVTSADGKTASFVQMDKKGKTVASTPITPESAMQGLQAMAFDRYQSMPGKFKEAFTMGTEREKMTETKRHNRAIEGIYSARAGGAGGTSGKFTLLGGGYKFNNKTGDVISPDGKVVTDPATLNEIAKFGAKPAEFKQLGEGLVQFGGQVFQQDAKTGEWVPAKGLPGSAPDKYAAVLGGKSIDTSRPGAPAPAAPAAAVSTGFTPTARQGETPVRAGAVQQRIEQIDQILQGLNVPQDKRFLLELERSQLLGGGSPRSALPTFR
jgi:hypothetical protein